MGKAGLCIKTKGFSFFSPAGQQPKWLVSLPWLLIVQEGCPHSASQPCSLGRQGQAQPCFFTWQPVVQLGPSCSKQALQKMGDTAKGSKAGPRQLGKGGGSLSPCLGGAGEGLGDLIPLLSPHAGQDWKGSRARPGGSWAVAPHICQAWAGREAVGDSHDFPVKLETTASLCNLAPSSMI